MSDNRPVNIVTASFITIMGQMAKMSQQTNTSCGCKYNLGAAYVMVTNFVIV